MAKKRNENFALRKVIVIVFLLLTIVFPLGGLVGVILMWLWMSWSKLVKIIITAIFILIVSVYVMFLGFFLTYILIGRPFAINGKSMNPNYHHGEYWMTKSVKSRNGIQRGDVVIIKNPKGVMFIERVIGLPKEKIAIKDGKVYINGLVLDESDYLPSGVTTQAGSLMEEGTELEIPDNYYFVMGDNRPHSSDSRYVGFVSENDISYETWFCYWNCSSDRLEN